MLCIRRVAVYLFLRIAEPRIIRLFYFLSYSILAVVGINFLTTPSPSVISVLGLPLSLIMALAIAAGGISAAFAVLPGIWWLERVGIISLATGILIYLVVLFAVEISSIPIGITFATIIFLTLRFIKVRKYQHSPGT